MLGPKVLGRFLLLFLLALFLTTLNPDFTVLSFITEILMQFSEGYTHVLMCHNNGKKPLPFAVNL